MVRRIALSISAVLLLVFASIGFQPGFSKGGEIPDTYVGLAAIEQAAGTGWSSDAQNVKDRIIEIRSVFGSQLNTEAPYVLILEIRNEDGVTMFLQWQNGTVNEHNESHYMFFYWRPTETGRYDVRNFAISNFTQPEILSTVRSSHAEIR